MAKNEPVATREEHIATLVDLATSKNKANSLASGQSEEVANAYAVINRDTVTKAVAQIYDLIVEAGLL
jgi:hypothetical protein